MSAMNKLPCKNNSRLLGMCGGIALLLGLGLVCSGSFFLEPSAQQKKAEAIVASANTSSSPVDPVASLLSSMTIEEKVGQLFVFGFHGTEPSPNILSAIKDKKIGGVILYDRNMQTPQQVAGLNNALKQAAAEARLGIPLFICVDQEGGIVTRMEDKVAAAPSQQKQGARTDREGVFSISGVTAKELRAMGFSVNFAPVLDLSEENSRSFGKNPEKTALLGKAAVDAYRANGILAAVKHFPGLGRSTLDTHFDFDVVKASADTLEKSDLIPFVQVMKSTDHNHFMVMMTHLIFPAYDSQKPSSISPAMIKGLLREKLGFSGLVITDDMEMGGLSKLVSYEAMGIRAVEAGIDILLVCQTKENQERIHSGLLTAVKAGKISVGRIDESVRRILKAKQVYQETLSKIVDAKAAETTVGSPAHREIMKNYGK